MRKIVSGVAIALTLFACATPSDLSSPPNPFIHLSPNCAVEISTPAYRIYHLRYTTAQAMQTALLLARIHKIEGIKNIYPSPYQIGVIIGRLYFWHYIQPQILDAIQQFEAGELFGDAPKQEEL